MKLELLSLKERVALCHRAATAAVNRLNLLAQWVDPKDTPLRRLFLKLAREEERHLAAIGRLVDQVGEAVVDEDRVLDRIIAGFFPSLSKSPGEAFIDRETGPYFAECLEEEAAHFYGVLTEQATDEESRAFFHQSKEERESRIRFVRTVLL